MIRVRYHSPGTPPATLGPPCEAAKSPAVVTLVRYNATQLEEIRIEDPATISAELRPGFVHWLNIDGLGDLPVLQAIAGQFQIHPLALEDILNTTQRPKVEPFETHLFVVAEMIYGQGADTIVAEQLSLFLGKDYVLTFQEESDYDVFDQVRARLRSGRGYSRRLGADYLAYALLDATVDRFYPILESIGDTIESIEEVLLRRPSKETLRHLYRSKRLLMLLRRASWPLREVFGFLLRDEEGFVGKEAKIFLRDCYDHCAQIIDLIESYRDLAGGLMDVYLSSLSYRTNDIMRVLTVVSMFFLPLTFLAGVYGMNFDTAMPWNMPELGWPFGYLAFWVLCMLTVATMWGFFKRRGWL